MTDYMEQDAERLIQTLESCAVDPMSNGYAEVSKRLLVAAACSLRTLLAHIQRGVPAPAGVPMPKPVAYGFGNTAITGHTNRLMMVRIDIPGGDQYAGAYWLPLVLADEALTYGERCRAAEMERIIRWLEKWGNDLPATGTELAASLRGEVKP